MVKGQRALSGVYLLIAIGGLIIWSSAFVVLYVALSLGCAVSLQTERLGGTNLLTIGLAILWLIHLAALGWLQWYGIRLWRGQAGPEGRTTRFLGAVTCLIGVVGIIATLFTGFPVLALPPCA